MRPSHNWSLTTRLSIAFSLISLLVFSAVGVLSYQHMRVLIEQQQDQALKARIERIEVFLQDQASFQILVKHPRLYENMLGQEDNLLILKNQNESLININPLNIQIPKLAQTSGIAFGYNAADQASTRLAYKTVEFNQQPYQLIAAKQLNEGQSTLKQYLYQLIIYSALGVLLSSILGAWVGRYLLASLKQLIEQTQQINIQKLHQRIEVKSQNIEVQQLQDAMNNMLDKIQTGYDQLAHFSEDIAHELRTPLNNLMGQTQISLSQSRSTDEFEQLLDSHLEEYERLNKMIESMLFIARSTQHDYQVEMQAVDVSKMALEMVDYFEFFAEDRDIQISTNLSPELYVYGNTDLLKRALSNLLVNAIDYGQQGQSIWLESVAEKGQVKITVTTAQTFIDERHFEHLFMRFYQVDESRHHKAQTGGLGLAIVASIMQLHDGVAGIENSERGVSFSLILDAVDSKYESNSKTLIH